MKTEAYTSEGMLSVLVGEIQELRAKLSDIEAIADNQLSGCSDHQLLQASAIALQAISDTASDALA